VNVSRDASGDILVVWRWSYHLSERLHATRLTSQGAFETGWPQYSLDLDDALDPMTRVLPDGIGGFFESSIVSGDAAYARHVLPNSTLDTAWPKNQTPTPLVSSAADDATITSDGAGGAIITWLQPPPYQHVVSARIAAAGIRTPPNVGTGYDASPGLNTTYSPETPMLYVNTPATVPDGSGGIGLVWLGNGIACFQHLTSTGTPTGYPAVDLGVHAPSTAYPFAEIVPSGANQYICAWIDTVGGLPELVAQRVDGDGNFDPAWPANGLVVVQSNSSTFSAHAVSDGADGILLAWSMGGSGTQALRLQSDGTPAPGWPAAGIPVGDGAAPSAWAIALSDAGGLLFAGNGRLWWYLADGTSDPATPSNGVALASSATPTLARGLAPDGAGGAYVVWDWAYFPTLEGGPPTLGHYAYGTPLAVGPTMTPAKFALGYVSPNPARDAFSVELSLPIDAPARLELLDISGRRVRSTVVPGAGEHTVQFASDSRMPPGIYQLRLTQGAQVRLARVAIVR
jgi:hypothetical protein